MGWRDSTPYYPEPYANLLVRSLGALVSSTNLSRRSMQGNRAKLVVIVNPTGFQDLLVGGMLAFELTVDLETIDTGLIWDSVET